MNNKDHNTRGGQNCQAPHNNKNQTTDSIQAIDPSLWNSPLGRRQFLKRTGAATVGVAVALHGTQFEALASESSSGEVWNEYKFYIGYEEKIFFTEPSLEDIMEFCDELSATYVDSVTGDLDSTSADQINYNMLLTPTLMESTTVVVDGAIGSSTGVPPGVTAVTEVADPSVVPNEQEGVITHYTVRVQLRGVERYELVQFD